jgi:hypothetical protein
MKRLILACILFVTNVAFGAELSPALEREGDFYISDKKGAILQVGHFDLDFTALYRDYSAGKEFQGKARFSLGRYEAGNVVDVTSSVMAYVIGERHAVLHLRPGIEDGGLDLLFRFDPSSDVLTADVEEGNIAGPRVVGSADIRFRRKKLN